MQDPSRARVTGPLQPYAAGFTGPVQRLELRDITTDVGDFTSTFQPTGRQSKTAVPDLIICPAIAAPAN